MERAELPSAAPEDRTAAPLHAPAAQRVRRARAVFLAVLGFTALAITRPVDANGNLWSRLSLTFAIVERGTLEIRPYLSLAPSPDWAEQDGRYYSNKAPGPALMAVPVYATQRAVQRRAGVRDGSMPAYRVAGWLANAVIGVLPTLLALALLWRLFERRYGFSPRGAFGMTALAGAASLSLPYSTMLFAHQTAAAFLSIGITLCLFEATRSDAPRSSHVALAGLCFGVAVLADHMAAIAVIAWSAWLLWTWRLRPSAWAAWVLGGAGPLAALLAFNHASFGSPWVGTYSSAVLNPTFAEAVLFHLPSVTTLYELTFGPARGWFYATPVFALTLAGVLLVPRLWRRWPELLPAAVCVAGALLLLASWNSWHGGNATGPRYLLWSMPFAVLLLVPVAQRLPRLVTVLGVLSAGLMLAVSVTEPLLPVYQDTDPFFRSALPILLGRQDSPMLTIWSLAGAPPALSLALFLLLWLAAGLWIDRQLRPEARTLILSLPDNGTRDFTE